MAKKIIFKLLGLFLLVMAIYAACRETHLYEISGRVVEASEIVHKDGNGYVEDKFVVIQREDGVKVSFRNDNDFLCLKTNSAKFQKLFHELKGKTNTGVVLTIDGFGNVRKVVPYFKRAAKPDSSMNRIADNIVGIGDSKVSGNDTTKTAYILNVNLDLHANTWTYSIHHSNIQTNLPPNKWKWRSIPENSIHGNLRITELNGSNVVRRVHCSDWCTGIHQ